MYKIALCEIHLVWYLYQNQTMRSSRLSLKLTTCSTTPRSGQKFVEELARNHLYEPHEQIYEEAKLALAKYDTETAMMLFDQCPNSYKNTQRYKKQCGIFKELCHTGILQREQTAELRTELAKIVQESNDSLIVSKYSELMYELGYTANTLKSMTLNDMSHMFSRIRLPCGYKTLIQSHFEKKSDACTRAVFHITRCIERCGGISLCIKMATKSMPRPKEEKDDEEETAD